MKISRQRILWIAIAAIVLPGVASIAWMPGPVEGVYNPFSSFGCTGDQFMEMKDGRVVTYVMCSNQALLMGVYEKDLTGSIMIRLPSGSSGEESKPIIRAEPHLLGTSFYYLGEGKSEWFWKRFVTKKMRDHMTGAELFRR